MSSPRLWLLVLALPLALACLARVSPADAQRRVTPPPRWVSDNTLWPAQYVPYVATHETRSLVLECAPYPTTSPSMLRCTARSRTLRIERLAEPYAALLASTQPGELERELERLKRRECGPEARPYERAQPTWSESRQQGIERYNQGLRALRGLLCQPCTGAACRDQVESIVTELNVTSCAFETDEEVLDLTPTGGMRWGSEAPDPVCGGRLVYRLVAESRDWVYTRVRQYDEDAPRQEGAPSRCDDTSTHTLRTGMTAYIDPAACTVLTL